MLKTSTCRWESGEPPGSSQLLAYGRARIARSQRTRGCRHSCVWIVMRTLAVTSIFQNVPAVHLTGADAERLLQSSREASVFCSVEVACSSSMWQVVSALLADVRDLFYLVDGSNLRPRLRPHPALSAPEPPPPPPEQRPGTQECVIRSSCRLSFHATHSWL